jgi:hypothetical protein
VRSYAQLLAEGKFAKLHEIEIAGPANPLAFKPIGPRDGGDPVFDDQLAISRQNWRPMDKNLIARIYDCAVVETDMGMQTFKAVADFDGARHLFGLS